MRYFFVKRLHFSIFLAFFWAWSLHLKTILDCGWTWTEFRKIRTGSGSPNMTARSSLVQAARDEHGSGLDQNGSGQNPI